MLRDVAIADLSELMGKSLLVGITYLGDEDEVLSQLQFAGVVTAVDPLVAIDRPGLDPFSLPAAVDAFDHAEPGDYRLRATGETVVNPDFITTWTVHTPD